MSDPDTIATYERVAEEYRERTREDWIFLLAGREAAMIGRRQCSSDSTYA